MYEVGAPPVPADETVTVALSLPAVTAETVGVSGFAIVHCAYKFKLPKRVTTWLSVYVVPTPDVSTDQLENINPLRVKALALSAFGVPAVIVSFEVEGVP